MKRFLSVVFAFALVGVPAARSNQVRMPAAPDPAPFSLPSGEHVVVASGSAMAPIRIDRYAIALAVPPADLPKAIAMLVLRGVPRDAIRPLLGGVLVELGMPSDGRLLALERSIDGATTWVSSLVPRELVAYRDRCDDAVVRADASKAALARAAAIAQGLGLGVDGTLDVSFLQSYYYDGQVVCGSAEPVVRSSAIFDLHVTHLPAFSRVFIYARGVFRISGDPVTADVPIAAQVGSSIAPNWHDPGGEALVARSVVIGPDRPFASGRGTYTILVRPDVILIAFAITHVGHDPAGVVAAMDGAAAAAGVPAKDRLARQFDLVVRVDPTDPTFVDRVQKPVLAASIQPAPYRDDGADIETFPFVRDCDALRTSLARQAMRRARVRAAAMSEAVGVGLGRLIGVADGGFSTDAACGYGIESPLADLVRATAFDAYGVFRPYAQFTQSVAAAWEIEEIAPDARIPTPRATPGYERSNVDRAFVAESGGIQESATATFHPNYLISAPGSGSFVDNGCEKETAAALGEAARRAASKARTRRIHALIDLGTSWPFVGGACYFALLDDGARGSRAVTVTESATVVP